MYSHNDYTIYDKRKMIQLDKVKALLKISYQADTRDVEAIKTPINNSICFSLFHQDMQVGFGRVVTDYASVAYLADLIISPEHRGKGLGKQLLDTMINDPRWKDKFKLLATDDAHTV